MASIFVATRVVFFYQGPFPDLPYPNSSGPLRNQKDSPFSSCKISRPSVVSGGSDGQLPIGIELVRFGVILVRIVKRISGHADDDSFLDANPVARHVSVAFALNSSRPKKNASFTGKKPFHVYRNANLGTGANIRRTSWINWSRYGKSCIISWHSPPYWQICWAGFLFFSEADGKKRMAVRVVRFSPRFDCRASLESRGSWREQMTNSSGSWPSCRIRPTRRKPTVGEQNSRLWRIANKRNCTNLCYDYFVDIFVGESVDPLLRHVGNGFPSQLDEVVVHLDCSVRGNECLDDSTI